MNTSIFINIMYILCSILFIFGIKLMQKPEQSKWGNFLSSCGMLLAVIITLFNQSIIHYKMILAGLLLGSIVGMISAKKIKMTLMPQMVALLNGFGGLASLLVGWATYLIQYQPDLYFLCSLFLTVFIGSVTFSGSLFAFYKLNEWPVIQHNFLKRFQKQYFMFILVSIIISGFLFMNPSLPIYHYFLFLFIIFLSLKAGLIFVFPIGGADMPVVISLLNSFSGLAACATGFVIKNSLLIVAGSLVGSSGLILTFIMCHAMNRNLYHVLFKGFSSKSISKDHTSKNAQSTTPGKAFYLLERSLKVVIVPGYGLAVAQAQNVLKELTDLLEANSCEVKFAIHPVAGRMPGHMNVLLADANISYDQLIDMDSINPLMETYDVCLIIGANDVVNTSARDDENSELYGMPIIMADKAKSILILKRSLSPGFAGIDNPLFYNSKTQFIFGDAKKTIEELIKEFKED